MEQLKFVTENQALQHLADITGSKIVIARDSTDLMEAIHNKDNKKITELLESGSKPNFRTVKTAIMQRSMDKRAETINALLVAGVEGKTEDNDVELLMLAIEELKGPDRIETLKVLLDSGMTPDEHNIETAEQTKDRQVIKLIQKAM